MFLMIVEWNGITKQNQNTVASLRTPENNIIGDITCCYKPKQEAYRLRELPWPLNVWHSDEQEQFETVKYTRR